MEIPDEVARTLGCEAAQLSWERIGGQAHEGTIGVFRIDGAAQPVVAKLMQSGGDARLREQIARESSVYADDTLVGDVRPARCLGRFELDDGTAGVLLEDLSDVHRVPWDAERYLSAAGALGRWQVAQREVDHAYAGEGALGEDLGTLYTSDFVFGRMAVDEWVRMEQPVFDAYRAAHPSLDDCRDVYAWIAGFDAGIRLVHSLARGDAPEDLHQRLEAVEALLRAQEE